MAKSYPIFYVDTDWTIKFDHFRGESVNQTGTKGTQSLVA